MPYSRVVIESTANGWIAEIDAPGPQQPRMSAARPRDLCQALGDLLEAMTAEHKKVRATIRPAPETISPKMMPPVSRRSKAMAAARERAAQQET